MYGSRSQGSKVNRSGRWLVDWFFSSFSHSTIQVEWCSNKMRRIEEKERLTSHQAAINNDPINLWMFL